MTAQFCSLCGLVFFLILSSAPKLSFGHVHGLSELSLIKKENDLLLEWKVPAFDLLGFEQIPASSSQKQKWQEVEAQLESDELLFAWPERAECRKLSSSKLESLTGSEGHFDLLKRWDFRCEKPELLRWVDLELLKRFPKLENLRVQILTESGAQVDQLGKSRQRAHFPKP